MSEVVAVNNATTAWESLPVKPLDEAVWQAWKAKGRAQDQQSHETRVKAVMWASILLLLAVAGFWSQLASYEIAVRCGLAAAACGMMFEAFNKRQDGLGLVVASAVPLVEKARLAKKSKFRP